MLPPLGLLNTLAPLQAWLSKNELEGMPESKIGWILSCYAFFITACGAQVELYQLLLSFGVCGGISASLLFNPAISVIGHWFNKRRALATGIACTAGGVGGCIFSVVMLYTAPRIGFPWAIRAIALVSAVLLLISILTLRKRLPNNKSRLSIDFTLLRRINFGITVLAIFLVEFAIFVPYSYISSYAIHYGFNLEKAYLLNVILHTAAIPGRIFPGYAADRVGAFNTMCATSFICAVLIFGLWLTSMGSEARVISFTVLFGFWSGAAISLSPVCISKVCRIEDYGKHNGIAYFIASFGALIGIPIAGALLDTGRMDSYQPLIIFAGGFYAASFVAFCIARGVAGGWKATAF
ncbi:hypothetical protein ACJ41O_006065 [Fusarium nematophilum]